jgi:hypothetical protein
MAASDRDASSAELGRDRGLAHAERLGHGLEGEAGGIPSGSVLDLVVGKFADVRPTGTPARSRWASTVVRLIWKILVNCETDCPPM